MCQRDKNESMKKKISGIIAINILPPIVFFALISAYTFLFFIPGLTHAAESGAGIERLTVTLLPYTLGLLGVTAVLFMFTAGRSLRTELSRERLKRSYDDMDDEFQTWVETTADGFIYIGDDGNQTADSVVLGILGCTAAEFSGLPPSEYIYRDVDGAELLDYLTRKDDDITGRYETRLVGSDGENREVLISASPINSSNMQGVILIVKDMSDQTRTGAVRLDVQREYSLVELQSALQYNYQTAGSMMIEPLLLDGDTPVRQAVEMMNGKHMNTFFVIDRKGVAEGIVTDQDIRQRIVSGEHEVGSPVRDIMSSPVVSAPVDIMFFEAFRLMRENSIRQLLIVNDDNRPIGLLTEKKLIEVQSTNAAAFSEELKRADTIEDMRDCYRRLVFSVRTLVQSGAKSAYIVNLVSNTAETITCKLIEKAFVKFGPPPCEFAFLVMGSEGRGEQTLLTDQDNGIVFADQPSGKNSLCMSYFLKIGAWVSDGLNRIGYAYCKGGVMASSPKWVKSLHDWKVQVNEWFGGESSDRLLDLNILFDFKRIYGNADLSRELRQEIWSAADRYPGFLRDVAAAVSVFKPPLTMFGRIQVKYTDEDYEVFDIKKALGPLTIYARTMALREKIELTSTTARLRELRERELITSAQLRDYEHAFDFLTQLRFRNQILAIEEGEELSNEIYLVDLSEVEIISLRRIFKQISNAQDSMRLALTGTLR